MVNSLERLFAEIINTLEQASQDVADPYVRSQVLAVIDILTNLAHRVEWKRSDLLVQIADVQGVCKEIGELLQGCGVLPGLQELLLQLSLPNHLDGDLLEKKASLSRILVQVMETLTAERDQIPAAVRNQLDRQLDTYLRRQLDRDLALVRAPLFRKMSQA